MACKVYELQGYAIVIDKISFLTRVFKADDEEGFQFNIRFSENLLALKFPSRHEADLQRELLLQAMQGDAPTPDSEDVKLPVRWMGEDRTIGSVWPEVVAAFPNAHSASLPKGRIRRHSNRHWGQKIACAGFFITTEKGPASDSPT